MVLTPQARFDVFLNGFDWMICPWEGSHIGLKDLEDFIDFI